MRPGTKLTLGARLNGKTEDGTVVHEAFRIATGAVFPTYALKIVPLRGEVHENQEILEEVDIFSRLHHHYVLRYHGSWVGDAAPGEGAEVSVPISTDGNLVAGPKLRQDVNLSDIHEAVEGGGSTEGKSLYILMERARSDLWTSLASFGDIIDDTVLWKWTIQLAAALEYIAAAGVTHRDINPWNVGINYEGKVTLMDFGMAIELAEGEQAQGKNHPRGAYITESSQTSLYSSPELGGEAYSNRVDVYSFGLTLYAMWRTGTWRASREEEEMDRLVADILEVKGAGRPQKWWCKSQPRLRELVRRCLGPADKRPSAAAVMKYLRWTDVLRSDNRYLKYGHVQGAPAGLPGVGLVPEDASLRALKVLLEKPYRPATDRRVLTEQNRDEQRLRQSITQGSLSPRGLGSLGYGGSSVAIEAGAIVGSPPPTAPPGPAPRGGSPLHSPGRHLTASPSARALAIPSSYSPSPPRGGFPPPYPPNTPGRTGSPPRSPHLPKSPDTTARALLPSRSRSITQVYASTTLKQYRRTGDGGIGLGGAAVPIRWLPSTKAESFHVQTLGWTDLSRTAPLPSGGPHALDAQSCLGWTGRAEGNWDGEFALPPINKFPPRGFPLPGVALPPLSPGGWGPGVGGLGDRGCLQGPMWGFYYDQAVPNKGPELYREVSAIKAN